MRTAQGKRPLRTCPRIDRYIFPNGRRGTDPVNTWADQADQATEEAIARCLEKVKADWLATYPEGHYGHNRLQLTYKARKIVFDQTAATDPNFRAKWEAEAARKEPVTEEERCVPLTLIRYSWALHLHTAKY